MGHKAVRGDVLDIVYHYNIQKTIAIGEEENPGLEYACIGKEEGDRFEYLDTHILIKKIYPMCDELQDRQWVPKVTDFFKLPEDRKSAQYEEVKFGIVNDVTEWKMDALQREKTEKIRAENEESERVLGHNTVGPRHYQKQKWTIDSEIKAYRKIRHNPYGVRLDYLNEKTHEIVTLYIGEQKIEDKKGAHVLGWNNTFQQILECDEDGRTTLSRNVSDSSQGIHLESLFHNDKDEFKCKGITYKLQLRRTYMFDNYERGINYEEVYNVQEDGDITDPLLRKVLESKRRQGEMTSIVYSIQSEQREIMYQPLEKNIVVQGCAGSGKTMILMHRISALLSDVAGLDAESVVILTPNEVFTESIDSLSATLEISKVGRESVDAFYKELIWNYLPDRVVEDELRDEAKLYTVDTLQKAYMEQTFEKILKEEDTCIQANREEIEADFLKIESLLKRNKIKQPQKKDEFKDYLESSQKTLADLQKKLGEQTASIKTEEEKIKNDEKRVRESRKAAQEAENGILMLMLKVLDEVEERKNKCILKNKELKAECEKITLSLQKNTAARDAKSYIDVSGSVNLVDLALSGEENLMELARSYQKTQSEITLLEVEKNKLNPNDIRGQFEIEEKLLQSRRALLDLYEKVPKPSDTITIAEETKCKEEIEQKQREIKQNESCIKACDSCITVIRETKGRNWPDLKQAEGHEILDDLTKEYQTARETIRVQTGRAENISKEIEKSQQTLAKLKEQQVSNEEREALKQLNDKLQSCTAESIIDESMRRACEMAGIKPDVVCRIQLLFLLQLCYGYFQKQVPNKIKLLCVDEAQDVSMLEIQLLRKILGEKIYWNLYGDYMQVSTAYKGQPEKAKLWEPIESQLNAELYTMDINYRNAQEIVEYCNAEFDMKITPMGLHGEKVIPKSKGVCWNEFIECLENCKEKYTAAIIVNNSAKFEEYKHRFKMLGRAYEIDSEDLLVGAVGDGKIALLDIKSAKGMEFRYVFVDKEGMTPNELYIAYTRAMETLFVAEEK